MKSRLGERISEDEFSAVYIGILKGEVLPSMRLMQFAGGFIDKFECGAYNCSFLRVNRLDAFSEITYLLMCGVGVGFSVEKESIASLPVI